MFLLDTNILTAIYKEQNIKQDFLLAQNPDNICTSIFCVTETWYGIKKLDNCRKKTELEQFFSSFFQDILIFNYGNEAMDVFTNIKVSCRKSGMTIEDPDLYIAATAIAHDCTLVTRNLKHFQNIENLRIEEW